MAEATIDELQIEIEADGADAAQSLEKLQQTLERLLSPVQALTTGNGLNKLTKQLEKLAEAGRAISSLSGLDKITQAANALKSLDALTGAPKVNSYVNAINKLSQASGAVQAIAAVPGRICAAFFAHECAEQSAQHSGYPAYAAHQQSVTASGGGAGYKFNARDRHIAH